MIVTPFEPPDFNLLKSDLVRSPGLHASDIYGDFYRQLDPKRYNQEWNNPLLLALGTAWEKHFEYLLRANGVQAYRPGEFLSPEGIAYSPDLIVFNGHTRVGEIKLTSMSVDSMPTEETNGLPPKMDKYLCQMMLYAFWLELVHGWLAVLFLYQPWKPAIRFFNLEWTLQELQANHKMLMNHAKAEGML